MRFTCTVWYFPEDLQTDYVIMKSNQPFYLTLFIFIIKPYAQFPGDAVGLHIYLLGCIPSIP